jgi:hypothetical protein
MTSEPNEDTNQADGTTWAKWVPLLVAVYGTVGFFHIVWLLQPSVPYRHEPQPSLLEAVAYSILVFVLSCAVQYSDYIRLARIAEPRGPTWAKDRTVGIANVIVGSIALLLFFTMAAFAFWSPRAPSNPADSALPLLFAAILVCIDLAQKDWYRKQKFGILPAGRRPRELTLEFLRTLRAGYVAKMRLTVAGSLVLVAVSLKSEAHLVLAVYTSAGLLLLLFQLLRATTQRIDEEILNL